MNFLAPAGFALGLLLPVIVALYLLKLRRTERAVSSTYLWRRVVRDVEANAPWQKLRPNLLLVLQLLFLLALVVALARPFTRASGISGEAAILIIDSSASMSATDSAPTRLEAAKARARQLVDDMPDTTRVTVIEAGQEASVRLASSRDRREAQLAVNAISPGTGGSDLEVALELASAVAARQPGTEIVVLSDGRVELPERMVLKGTLTYLPVGVSGENQAITLFNLETRPAGGLAAFAQVRNYGKEAVTRRLSLYADGQLFNAYDLALEAGGEQALVIEDLPAGVARVEARLSGADVLALDDAAFALPPAAQRVRITLVTPGNIFLQTALEIMQRQGSLDLLVLGADEAAQQTDADLIIYDSVAAPDPLPERGSLLFIAPLRSTALFDVTGIAPPENTALTPRVVNPSNPLAQNLTLAGVNILDTAEVPLPGWAEAVIVGDYAGGSTPLLLHGETGGRRAAVLAFDLHHSDLPLQTAFPLLWVNLLDWLAPGLRGAAPTQAAAGELLAFTLPGEPAEAQIRLPDGKITRIQPENGRVRFTDTAQLGVYEITWGENQRAAFAVNLFSPQESDLDPAGNLPGLAAQAGQSGGELEGTREFWRPLIFLALGLLVGEWLVYQRAGLARLRDWLRARLIPAKSRAR